MKEELAKRFGAHRVMDVSTAEGEIPLIMLDLELRSPVSVLMTNGLSDYKMPVPENTDENEYNEIYFCLPSYWEWEDMENPRTNWVFSWIQRIAKHAIEQNTWLGHGHTMPCGANMESLSETMLQNHFILSNPLLLEMELLPIKVDGREINFLGIIPIFSDEMDYKQGKGTFKLMQKLSNKGVTEQLDDFRATILKRSWKFRR